MATSHSNNNTSGAIGASNTSDHSNNMETNQFHPQHQIHPQQQHHQNLSTRLNIDPGLQQQQSNSLPIHALSHQHSHQQQVRFFGVVHKMFVYFFKTSALCLHFFFQLPSPNYQQPTPWTISEGNSHCVHVFDKLRVQREQSRFADLILSVRGREFAAHRCVMAA